MKSLNPLRKIILIFVVVILLSVALEFLITWNLVRGTASRSTTQLLDQIEATLSDNDANIQSQTDDLKATYQDYAKIVAYMLSAKPEAVQNSDELTRIANSMQIDEINVFDASGTIYSGTVPKYFGMSFDSGEQMGYFKPMLKDKTLSMCQDITPNTAEAKSMMYAIAWNDEGTMMVQVGIEPKRLLAALERSDISTVINDIPLTDGYTIYIIDAESMQIAACSNSSLVGTPAADAFGSVGISFDSDEGTVFAGSGGAPLFCNYRTYSGEIITVTYLMTSNMTAFVVPAVLLVIYLIIAAIIITTLFNKLYRADLEKDARNRELLRAKQAAEEANAAKTSFLFNMSHDIRTPMNAIIGFADLLEKHQDDPDKRADYLRKIQGSSSVLLSIINNVLEMARIEKGTLVIEENVWSAEQMSDSLYSIFAIMMREKNLTFTHDVNVEHHYVHCDQTKLREVFINIIGNAYKYTEPGGEVRMLLEEVPAESPGYVSYRTTIADTGIGMSEEFLPHLFEEFTRERTTTESKVEGTGLGMPIVKRLVELMGGTIEVSSKLGEGTTFVVTIPHRIAEKVELEKAGLNNTSNVASDHVFFEGKSILLVEDNDLNAEIATEILGEMGFALERAEDGAIAVQKVEAAEAGHYDVVLMDIQMPNMNGYEATRAIRALPDSDKANVPILAMTANAFEEDRREAIEAGMQGHLAKPIDTRALSKTLATILKL